MDYVNYVIEFKNGAVKVGTSSRPFDRIKEHERSTNGSSGVKRFTLTPPILKETAYQIEADLCRLLGYGARANTREWFDAGAWPDTYGYLSGTTGMFWLMRTGLTYEHLRGLV